MLEVQIEKLTHDHYDRIMNSIIEIAKHYSVERVPLNMVNEVINRAKINSHTKEKKIQVFNKKFNQTLNILKKVCKEESKRTIGDNKISLNEFQQMIQILKSSFSEELMKNTEI